MSFLKGCLKILAAPQQLLAKGIEKLGNLLQDSNNDTIQKIGSTLENFGNFLTPTCYKKERANIEQTRDFGFECEQLFEQAKEKILPEAEKISNKEMEHLKKIKKALSIFVPPEVFARIEDCIPDDPFKDSTKHMLNALAQKISSDNNVFLSLVKIESYIDRKQRCQAYIETCIRDNLEKCDKAIQTRSKQIAQDMISAVQDYVEELQSTYTTKQNEYNEFLVKNDDPNFVLKQIANQATEIAYLSCIYSLTSEN